MRIVQDFLAPGQGARPGVKLTQCQGLVIHWIGAPQGRAEVIRQNFERAEFGAQYLCDWHDGHIIQCMPEDEVAYHMGAAYYTALKRERFGDANPNWRLVGIECCIGDKRIPADYSAAGKYLELGRPSHAQYAALVEFAAAFLIRHSLTTLDLYRHYDITGKHCHVWFVKDEARWNQFRADVRSKMRGEDIVTQEQFDDMMDKYLLRRGTAPADNWAAEDWRKAQDNGLMDGTRPLAFVTRQELAAVANRMKEGT